MTKLRFLLSIFLFFNLVYGWDLKNLRINGNYYTSSLTIYKNRAFFTIPRSSCFNKLTYPTLVEVLWTGDKKIPFFRKKVFPNNREQTWNTCKHIQDAISVDVELKGRLWVLDKGNMKCPPKVLIYNLHFNNLIHRNELNGIPKDKLNSLVLDPVVNEWGPRAYIGDIGDNKLIVFSYNNMSWWKLNLMDPEHINLPIGTQYLTVSKEDTILYLTSSDSFELFALDILNVRESAGPLAIIAKVSTHIPLTFYYRYCKYKNNFKIVYLPFVKF